MTGTWLAQSLNLGQLLAEAVKTGEEFMLYYHPYNKTWSCDLGNRSQMVLLGEVPGECQGAGASPEEALFNALGVLRIGG